MSDVRWLTIVEVIRHRTPVPTGWRLLALVRSSGDLMLEELREGTRERYLERRDAYLELLAIAQNDAYCAPILISSAQAVFDEESALYRSGQQRLDKSR